MLKAKIVRYNQNAKQIQGEFIFGKYKCDTLELSWKNNQREISCIPQGKYIVKRRYSPKYKDHFEVTNVKNRTAILIHAGNYYIHTNGCILVGKGFKDLNKDGYLDILQSTNTLNELLKVLPKEPFELEIVFEPRINI